MPSVNPPWLTPELRSCYEGINLKLTQQTRPSFTDANVIETPKMLGSGFFNTVFEVQLRSPNGTKADAVFKPLSSSDNGWVARETGIPLENPQIAMRNIATADYAKALGFDVIPHTSIGFLTMPTNQGGTGTPALGLVMERAAGEAAAVSSLKTLQLPEVIREVTKLQLLDHLTGQGDRHADNYFVHVEQDGPVKVTGIDNDQCFGKKLTDPEGIRHTGHLNCGFRGTGLPPVVDYEMAIAINSLTPGQLDAMLGDKLSEPEVDAAKQRLVGVQEHIVRLQEKGLVIDPHQWSESHLLKDISPENSYAVRELSAGLQNAEPRQSDNRW